MYSHTENQQCADVAYCHVLFLDLKGELTRPVIMGQLCDINTLTVTEHQSARMSKITNDSLTQSGTGCFIAVTIRKQWAS